MELFGSNSFICNCDKLALNIHLLEEINFTLLVTNLSPKHFLFSFLSVNEGQPSVDLP